MDLRNKVVVITGGGSGIGRALALTFAKEGARVACLGRRLERLNETIEEIEKNGGSGLAVQTDITDAEQVKTAVTEITEKLGPIEVLFNNAGSFASLGAFFEIDRDLWWQDVTVNIKGVMLMMREVLPQMMERDSGIIINMNGGRPVGGSGYAAGKAGIMEMTRVASLELHELQSNVVILGAGPGLVQTEMTQLQADTEAGQRWIPSTKESIDAGTTRSPFDIAHKTIEVLKAVKPQWNGKYFGPETNLSELDS
jgi:NAD(P)-dependent dehydrogenase (short-subunit alcohol dehydrogenase family)